MKFTITVTQKQEIEVDETLLTIYAEEVRERYEMNRKEPVYMTDLLTQASIDGDIQLPDNWELDDYYDPLSDEEIEELESTS